ncbi:MAG: hypothetical protein KGD73_11890 [Candidatus Lokiarchaeota archaeon]|nr:hypothetical protein [Candidatus Lokiarchaeota archaeon]
MTFNFLLDDLNQHLSRKTIGTDKGLAKLGDSIINLTYSMAKSIYLTRDNSNNRTIRTGLKVSKKILAEALKNADLKPFAKNRGDAHDMADTVEAIVAYVWLSNKMSLDEIIEVLWKSLSGDISIRNQEIETATKAFTTLLNTMKIFLPEQ